MPLGNCPCKTAHTIWLKDCTYMSWSKLACNFIMDEAASSKDYTFMSLAKYTGKMCDIMMIQMDKAITLSSHEQIILATIAVCYKRGIDYWDFL